MGALRKRIIQDHEEQNLMRTHPSMFRDYFNKERCQLVDELSTLGETAAVVQVIYDKATYHMDDGYANLYSRRLKTQSHVEKPYLRFLMKSANGEDEQICHINGRLRDLNWARYEKRRNKERKSHTYILRSQGTYAPGGSRQGTFDLAQQPSNVPLDARCASTRLDVSTKITGRSPHLEICKRKQHLGNLERSLDEA